MAAPDRDVPRAIRPAVPGIEATPAERADQRHITATAVPLRERAPVLVKAFTFTASGLAALSWLPVVLGAWLLLEARGEPEGMAGFAAFIWLSFFTPIALALTGIAAFAWGLLILSRMVRVVGAIVAIVGLSSMIVVYCAIGVIGGGTF